MPSVGENREKWTAHDWVREGHEWSPGGTREGTDLFWWRSILPRLHAHLPAGTLLEIGPGFGRWTAYLLSHCRTYIGVDVTERCIDVCRAKFGWRPAASFHLNDGESLPMVGDGTVDLAFSFDSLVHVEAPQILAYLRELARTLKPGGAAFIHHSNLGGYVPGRSGEVPAWIARRHWRAASMSAAGFRAACRAAGLTPATQELINWIGRGRKSDQFRLPGPDVPLTDCVSVAVKTPPDAPTPPTRVLFNRRFVDEWRELLLLAPLYAAPRESRTGNQAMAGAFAETPGVRDLPARLREYAAAHWTARQFRRHDPVTRAIAAGECPDCGGRLTGNTGTGCEACRITLALR